MVSVVTSGMLKTKEKRPTAPLAVAWSTVDGREALSQLAASKKTPRWSRGPVVPNRVLVTSQVAVPVLR